MTDKQKDLLRIKFVGMPEGYHEAIEAALKEVEALERITPKRGEVLRYRYKSTRYMKTRDLREHIRVAASDVNELLDALGVPETPQ